MESSNNEFWSSERGFILASAGAAIGLGQIWKFPYMVGANGGGAFLLCYVFFVFFLAMPVFMAEVILGKLGRNNLIASLRSLALEYNFPNWSKLLGPLGLITLFIILCFYNVIASWSLPFMVRTKVESGFFYHYLQDIPALFICFFIYTLLCSLVVCTGVRAGIERTCLILMPVLMLILIILVLWSTTLEGMSKAIHFLLVPNIKNINPGIVLQAAGHALFSLATGAGCAFTYGAKLPNHVRIVRSTTMIALCNLFVAVCAGFAIFPAVYTFGLTPTHGPTLMYELMPQVFSLIPYGTGMGLAFFSLLFIAALTSSVSLMEPWIVFIRERWGVSRIKASGLLFVFSFLPSLYFLLSFNLLKNYSIFTFVADKLSSLLLLIGALGFSLLFGHWIPKSILIKECKVDETSRWVYCLHFFIRWFVPMVIIILMISSMD